MSRSNEYMVGALVRVFGSFFNESGPITPTAVVFKSKSPSAVVATLATVVDSAGNYHADISVTAAGTWSYSCVSTGSGQAAKQGQFEATASLT